jgi:predicted N-acetyltransferase YhbS
VYQKVGPIDRGKPVTVTIREAVAADAAECGRILYAAFAGIANQHNFPPDFPSLAIATDVTSMLIAHPGFYGLVAEEDGHIVGSNFMDQRSLIGGIGPISVDPAAQNQRAGRTLMQAMLDYATARDHAGIRLVQTAYHNRSLALYTRLGFVTREPLSVMRGEPLGMRFAGYEVRPATAEDIAACNQICRQVHGFARDTELAEAVRENRATVVERLGRITGYATAIGFFAHAVAESNQDLKALIGAARTVAGPGFLLPTRNHDLFNWCLESRLQLLMQMTLMTIGLYNEPAGAYLPSILY